MKPPSVVTRRTTSAGVAGVPEGAGDGAADDEGAGDVAASDGTCDAAIGEPLQAETTKAATRTAVWWAWILVDTGPPSIASVDAGTGRRGSTTPDGRSRFRHDAPAQS